jgi:S-DNA-T family DNA segregation ATPase FtsK/SpoIIIE
LAQKKSSKTKSSQKSNTKSNTKKKTAASKKKTEQRRPGLNPQVKAILLCAAAIILLALILIRGGSVWLAIHRFLFGLFGFCAVLIPFVFLYLGIMTAKEKQMAHKGTKVLLSVLIVLFTASLIYLCGGRNYNEDNTYLSALGASYLGSLNPQDDPSQAPSMCGMIGTLIGYPMRAWLTRVPSVIISIVGITASAMILFRVTLVDIANIAKKGYHKQKESWERHRGRVEERRRERERIEAEETLAADPVIPDYTAPAELPVNTGAGRIDIPIDAPNRSKRVRDAQELADDAHDQEIIDIINTANNTVVPDGEQDASAVARRISRKKTSNRMTEGAKQADPETVEVDLGEETRRMDEEVKKEEAKTPQKARYVFPPTRLLNPPTDTEGSSAYNEMQNNATKLVDTLRSFGVNATITNICRGPSVTRYELQPAAGVKISKITNLSDDIALNLAAEGIRIEAPIPGKAAVGIEVPNKVISRVTIRELLESDEFRSRESKLYCVLGRNISGEIVCTELSAMPHLLIAGTTGSGKSVCVNSLLLSILFRAAPDEVKLLLIDPKMVEFSKYKGIPHLLVPVVSDAKKAAGALNWAVSEMLSRYRIFAEYECKGIDSYNELVDKNLAYIEMKKAAPDYDPEGEPPCMEIDGLKVPTEHMSRIVIAIDELADLMMAAPAEVEESICRLAQMARAAGMHLIIATQRPSVNVITGVIKANIPSRIALQVSSQVDSRTILDSGGAEKLIGKGDMLYAPVGTTKPIRVQGCFATDDEIERVTDFIRKSHQAEYNQEVEEQIRRIAAEELGGKGNKGGAADPSGGAEVDAMMEEAIKVVIEAGQASTSLLQRRLKVGYARAGRLIDDMEQMGIVGPHQGSKPRDVLMTYNEWLERNQIIGAASSDSEPDSESGDEPW